ncbi:aldose 1-epimerase [Muriicola sp. Z0-33]|nr:aldose 1-epimerase [Muriicola sp. Z0-33]
MTTLLKADHKVAIEDGELISYQVAGHEYIHQKGSPGWGSSDTEMFPIIGPTADAGYRVQVPRANALQDQHGILRELEYQLLSKTENGAIYQKEYKSGTVVNNSKYPEKSTARLLIWPFNFNFKKEFELVEDGLQITFTVSGERDMPYMLGYHPAFKLHSEQPYLETSEKRISLDEVLAVGSRALEIPDCARIALMDENSITIETEGFGHLMLWTEVPNMICIEPITFYPYSLPQSKLHEGFDYLAANEKTFKVLLSPEKTIS